MRSPGMARRHLSNRQNRAFRKSHVAFEAGHMRERSGSFISFIFCICTQQQVCEIESLVSVFRNK